MVYESKACEAKDRAIYLWAARARGLIVLVKTELSVQLKIKKKTLKFVCNNLFLVLKTGIFRY